MGKRVLPTSTKERDNIVNPIVSIITPTFNRANLLPRVWESLKRQTLQDFQWIVVDDGSSDNTREVIAGFNDLRINYIYQENCGVNGARNRGEQEISSEYVVFLDSDDEFFSDTSLQEMVREIQNTRPEIAFVAFTVVDSEGKEGLSYLSQDYMETSYIDHVCEQNIRGEFFFIYRRDVLQNVAWPPFNGMEVLRHWRIIEHRPALMVNRPARIYHRKQGDNMTGAHSAIRRASSMAEAIGQLIAEHRKVWSVHCPSQLGKYQFYKAMYLSLCGPGWYAIPAILIAIRFGTIAIRCKAAVLALTLFLPLSVRQQLFILRAENKR